MTHTEACPDLQLSKVTLNEVVEDLRNIDFRQEIVPVDATILASMRRDFVFWSAAVLAVVPLGLMTLEGQGSQITGFCLFAAAMWGVVFARYIVNANTDWRLLVGSLFFTGLVGIPVLLTTYNFLPSFYNALPVSSNALVALLGSIVHTGVTEELCKIAPVLLYLVMRRQSVKPLDLVLIGVFSGLGFAAFENVIYVGRSVEDAFAMTDEFGVGGLITGVQGAMINGLLRSLSCVCAHAVWSGIFSYFIAMAVATRKRFVALFIVGWVTAAVLHGFYNGMQQIQQTAPAIVVFGSFVLFYAYLTRLRLTVGQAGVTASS